MKTKYWLLPLIIIGFAWIGYSKNSENIPDTAVSHNEFPPSVQDEQYLEPEKETVKAVQKAVLTHQEMETTPIDRIRRMPEMTQLQAAFVEDHDNYNRYPPENRRFTSVSQDPLTQRYAIDERTTLNEEKTVGLTLWSDKKYYLQNDDIQIYAFIQNGDGEKLETEFTAELLSYKRKLGNIELIDEDNDQMYQSIIPLSDGNLPINAPGIYKVIVSNDEHNIKDAITFTLSKPDISLTGNYRDKISADGNLIIEAQVDVASTDRFYIQASLYSSTHVPVGTTQVSQQLTTGKHWIPLSFAGLMIQDANESGPYVLQQLSLAKVTMPMQRAPIEKPNFITDAYALDEFSSSKYAVSDKL